jgi:glycosyltransferase involved in cell wall biosynthesis
LEYADSFGNEKVPNCPYFLYVGSRVVYKNFDLLLKAFSKIKDMRPGVKLCIVGAKLTDDESKKVAQLGLIGFIEHAGFVTSPHLAKLYRCSLALVYPSKYEGFGLPPLEAMTCRTAVIAANVSSVPEVLGNGGILIDPNSVNELTDAMLLLIDNQSARDKIIENGIKRSQLFSWDTNVNEIVKLYNKLV